MASTGISEIGEVTGGGGTCAEGQSGGFAWYGAYPLYYLPMPQGFTGAPVDINSSRQMAGYMIHESSSFPRAMFHENGTTIDLGWLPGHSHSEAVGISEDGVVCANSWGLGSKVFIWQNGQIAVLDLPLGPFNVAFGISDNHLVCGWMGEADTTIAHAFIHDLKTGQTFDIGTPLPGTINAQATSVNNRSDVCGWSFSEPNGKSWLGRRGFIWSQGQVQEINALPAFPQVIPKAINDSNVVVGACFEVFGTPEAFVWIDGVTYALRDLVATSLPLNIAIATSINNAGQIAAYGHYPDPQGPGSIYVAMRLNPVPPLTGDITCDWKVNVPDLLAVLNAWGSCPPPPPNEPFTKNCHADLNDDNVVNLEDLLAVVLNWSP